MLRKIRLTAAVVFFTIITLLFLDFTGTIHGWFGWMAKIQFLPAILALNVGVVVFLVVLTLLFGRIYCSVICPMGVFQDIIAWGSKKRKKKKKSPYNYSPAINWLRYGALGVFIITLVASVDSTFTLLAPYSSYGRIANNLFAPIWQWGNNLLAYLAERANSYAFYEVDVWIKSLSTFIVAAVTLIVIFILAWRYGRTYCNTICPVGTVLGFLSRFSLFRITIDADKCNKCSLCSRNCKASCIDYKEYKIDNSRCVTCMNCVEKCNKGAITYKLRYGKNKPATNVATQTETAVQEQINDTRRGFLSIAAVVATTSVLKAQEKGDGGLAVIADKKIPDRETPIVPAGALSLRNMAQHCTACQLCVSVCPNQVLRPSSNWSTMMQPEISYERGYCRPECTKCSEVCPAGAIRKITKEEKSSIQVGHAVWIKQNCVVFRDNMECGNCARHCPAAAIQMVASDPENQKSLKIPVVNTERCIGCGACENLCPSRPFSAIYVEGHSMHRII
ncbi:4Fe-4S binding protein [Bacteroides sp. 519]|uniref:4Fe-4S binding protein n=1 Tax=Bacteroides sp. 519 TaxID=2302937 RepID=UPI0013CFCA48|nr:4Fe-4S binding protein [Bacteroides sp. 519]NDV58303.1 4Fe-4S dicluster domain-containing protein [Bacteroides sp. 519]